MVVVVWHDTIGVNFARIDRDGDIRRDGDDGDDGVGRYGGHDELVQAILRAYTVYRVLSGSRSETSSGTRPDRCSTPRRGWCRVTSRAASRPSRTAATASTRSGWMPTG